LGDNPVAKIIHGVYCKFVSPLEDEQSFSQAFVGGADSIINFYSDVDSEHDYVVQAKGAFEKTDLGFHNLARYDVPVEIRVVIHIQTCRHLPKLAEFIARNFPITADVALIGMEMYGFVNQNLDELWIDPHDYQAALYEATETLFTSGMDGSIYNHQLCVLDRRLWPFARKSISERKSQIKRLSGSDAQGQAKFVLSVFQIAA
jgi:hypothetical protein